MKNTITKLCILVLICVLTVSFVACNNTNIEEQKNNEDSNNSTSTESEYPFDIPEEVLLKTKEIYGSHSIGPQIVTTVQQLAILTSISCTLEGHGPITVTPAKLNGEEITLITLGGTQFVDGQATTIKESALAAQGKSNDYLIAVKDVIIKHVPKDKPLLITGISLGGMIAQQLLGEDISVDYDIRAIITFGSPLTMPIYRFTKVVRFQDINDQVPTLGEMYVNQENKEKVEYCHSRERKLEQSKYTEMVETHALSYIEDECWNKYDFLGEESGTNILELLNDMSFYAAPIITK